MRSLSAEIKNQKHKNVSSLVRHKEKEILTKFLHVLCATLFFFLFPGFDRLILAKIG